MDEPRHSALGDATSADIEAVAFLVLMEAARATSEDLRDIMRHVEAINHAKKALRELLERLGGESEEIARSLRCIYEDAFVSTELGELESLELQMALDRRSKLLSTLSNLLKKVGDTERGIVDNLK